MHSQALFCSVLALLITHGAQGKSNQNVRNNIFVSIKNYTRRVRSFCSEKLTNIDDTFESLHST